MNDDALTPQDRALLERVANGNSWLRSVLCTLARRGTQLRHEDPPRAAELIRQLSTWPWFKGGQFLFDLMEWEDFMVDGAPPPLLPTVLQQENWERLDALLTSIRALIDAGVDGARGTSPLTIELPNGMSIAGVAAFRHGDVDLPPLEPSLHLYRDVVLGIWVSLDVNNASGRQIESDV